MSDEDIEILKLAGYAVLVSEPLPGVLAWHWLHAHDGTEGPPMSTEDEAWQEAKKSHVTRVRRVHWHQAQ